MSLTCRNLCIRYKASKPKLSGRYEAGQKRCNYCDIFIGWNGIYCPCCGARLRLGPRQGKYKKRFHEKS